MLKVYIHNPQFDIDSILQAKGLCLSDSNPNILHFLGADFKELDKALKLYKPELVISHTIQPRPNSKFLFVYHPVNSKIDFLRPARVWTNCPSLCSHYYRRLGIFPTVIDVKQRKERSSFPEFILRLIFTWNRIKKWMCWE